MKRLFFCIPFILFSGLGAHAELKPLTTNEMQGASGQSGSMAFMPESASAIPGILLTTYLSAATPLPQDENDDQKPNDAQGAEASLPGSALERMADIDLPTMDDFFDADVSMNGSVVKSGNATFDGTTLKLENYTVTTPETRFDNIRPEGMTGSTYGSISFGSIKATMSGTIRIRTVQP